MESDAEDLSPATETLLKVASYGIMTPYMIGWGLSIPLYNYQYARTHGFLSWLFFGEILATIRAALWPYDLYMVMFG